MGYKPCCNNGYSLSDDLTDAEALAIVTEEFNKLDKVKVGIEVASGNYNSINLAIKESVKKICVKGAIKQANNVYVWVGGAIAGLLLLWLILK